MKKITSLEKLLGICIAFVFCMIVCRIWYTESKRYLFLVWNVFLAWIPFKLSLYLNHRNVSGWKEYLIAALWLLFFPNALYIVTDLIHLETKTNMPIWYDAALLFTAALTGLIMAFISLYNVEFFLIKKIGKKWSNLVICCCLFLGAFGVYLGRFLRLNSWDIVTDPTELTMLIVQRLVFPHEHWRTWGITILFTGLFSMLYFLSKKIPDYLKPGK